MKSMGNPDFTSAGQVEDAAPGPFTRYLLIQSCSSVKNIPVLKGFVCRECGREKTPPQFSNKELLSYKYKKSQGVPVNNVTAKLRCRICTGEQRQELRCKGPCGYYKDLDGFSKNARKNHQPWCIDCINWKEAFEPGVNAFAPLPQSLAPDEEAALTLELRSTYSVNLGEETSTLADGDEFRITIGGSGGLQGVEEPELQGVQGPSARQGASTTGLSSTSENLAPHLRRIGKTGVKSTSTISNPFLDRGKKAAENSISSNSRPQSVIPAAATGINMSGGSRVSAVSQPGMSNQTSVGMNSRGTALASQGPSIGDKPHEAWPKATPGPRNPPVAYPTIRHTMTTEPRGYASDDSWDEM